MSSRINPLRLAALSTLLLAATACDSDADADPVCEGEPELVSVQAPDTAAPGDAIEMTFEVNNFEFSREGDGHDHDHDHEDHGDDGDPAAPGDDVEFRAVDPISAETGCFVGHVHVYIDDVMTNPVAQLTVESGSVTLPDDLEPGEHRLINRLHDSTHKIIEPQVIVEHTITIQ
ncbi:MAG: DUF6130 family protein [Myxococcota bacterium]